MALSNAGLKWTEQEILLAMELYFRVPFGQISTKNPDILELARLLGRTPGSVSMKLANLARLDPSLQARNVSGLVNGSKLDGEVFQEYYGRFDELATQAYEIRQQIQSQNADEYDHRAQEGETTGTAETNTRSGQEFFRASVLAAYSGNCCVTGLQNPSLLVACHIKPLDVCASEAERVDPSNGLCFNAFHGAAFDSGLLTVSKEYKIVFSHELDQTEMDSLMKTWLISTKGQEILLPDRFSPSSEFLEYHNDVVFRG